MQSAIKCTLMRGGTSKGAYFLKSDLPANETARDNMLLAVMGSPDARQIDGVGGANPLTSKVAIVSVSDAPGIDVEYLFAQVALDKPVVSYGQNCGQYPGRNRPVRDRTWSCKSWRSDHRCQDPHGQ